MKNNASKLKLLQEVYNDVFELKKSPLYKYRLQNNYVPVIGEGNPDASIVFIGEAPGKNEALTGKPFCGASGKILDELLHSVTINRSDVYISSIVKDRPPENRYPTPEEIEIYSPFLDRQLVIIQPQVVVTLGRLSMEYIMNKFGLADKLAPISTIHGKIFDGTGIFKNIKVIPLFHPAVALYRRDKYATMKKDFEILRQFTK